MELTSDVQANIAKEYFQSLGGGVYLKVNINDKDNIAGKGYYEVKPVSMIQERINEDNNYYAIFNRVQRSIKFVSGLDGSKYELRDTYFVYYKWQIIYMHKTDEQSLTILFEFSQRKGCEATLTVTCSDGRVLDIQPDIAGAGNYSSLGLESNVEVTELLWNSADGQISAERNNQRCCIGGKYYTKHYE